MFINRNFKSIMESANSQEPDKAIKQEDVLISRASILEASEPEIKTAASKYAQIFGHLVKDDGSVDSKDSDKVYNASRGLMTYIKDFDEDQKNMFQEEFMRYGDFTKGPKQQYVYRLLTTTEPFSDEEIKKNSDNAAKKWEGKSAKDFYDEGNSAIGKKQYDLAHGHYKNAFDKAESVNDKKYMIRSLGAMVQTKIKINEKEGTGFKNFPELEQLLELAPNNKWAKSVKEKLKSGVTSDKKPVKREQGDKEIELDEVNITAKEPSTETIKLSEDESKSKYDKAVSIIASGISQQPDRAGDYVKALERLARNISKDENKEYLKDTAQEIMIQRARAILRDAYNKKDNGTITSTLQYIDTKNWGNNFRAKYGERGTKEFKSLYPR